MRVRGPHRSAHPHDLEGDARAGTMRAYRQGRSVAVTGRWGERSAQERPAHVDGCVRCAAWLGSPVLCRDGASGRSWRLMDVVGSALLPRTKNKAIIEAFAGHLGEESDWETTTYCPSRRLVSRSNI